MSDDKQSAELLEFTSTIVAAHVANNAMPASEPPRLIATAHETLDAPGTEKDAEKPKPAVAIKKSVTPDNITFLKHGKKQKCSNSISRIHTTWLRSNGQLANSGGLKEEDSCG